MNKEVSFPIAKLLKEKGFDEPCDHYYYKGNLESSVRDNWNRFNGCSVPTIAEVVMWLYEKYEIWIRITPIPYSDNLTHWRWEHMSTNYSTRNLKWKKEQDYMSPTEAYEAAIEYTLKNLI